MKDDRPIKQRYYPKNPAMQRIIDDQIDELLKNGCIEPSKSPHRAPIVLVGKKTGEVRMCIDYRQLNANSIPDAYPLPQIHHILERLRNASHEYTALSVPGRGLFHCKVMPFRLHSAPATFQRALDSVIGPDMEPFAFAYLDDIIVSGATLEEHVHNLGEVLRRLRQANLRLNRAKCKFFRRSLVYLGHVISGEGIHTNPDKIAAVRELQPPATCRQKWEWNSEQQAAFEELKARLTEAPVLACPDFNEKEEYEEVLAAADGVDPDLGEDLPLDQLDWMKASEGWFLNGLAGRVPVAVYEAVQMARPRAALRTIKFLGRRRGRHSK
ncbi:hypothetical protein ACLKA6_003100 [Drosophila palustris]